MIDLHAHILHNFDDGPADLAGSLALARAALDDGITVMAATPHGRSAFNPRYSVELLYERLNELRTALAAEGLPLELVPGTELYCEADLSARLRAGELLTYGESRAVLVEFPSAATIATLEQMLFALQSAGYRVLIAHPERIRVVQDDPNRLIPLIERGALLQITAAALAGAQGRQLQRTSETLLVQQMVHVIASDSHGEHVGRLPMLSAAVKRAARLIDKAVVEQLVSATPAAILADAPLDLPRPQPRRPRRWW